MAEWGALAREIVVRVVVLLEWDRKTTGVLRLVSKRWREAIDGACPLLEFSGATDDALRMCARFHAVKTLDCGKRRSPPYSAVTDDGLRAAVSSCTTLTALDLSGCGMATAKGLWVVSKLTNLVTLKLHQVKLTGDGLRAVASLPWLTDLDLSRYDRAVSCLTGLISLSLSGDDDLTDEDLQATSSLCALRSLKIHRRSRVERLPVLSTFTVLTSLQLICEQLVDDGFRAISRCTTLTELSLYGCKKLNDSALREMSNLTALTSLQLCGCLSLGTQGLRAVGQLRMLTSLGLRACVGVSDEALQSVSNCTALTWLDLCRCWNSVTDRGLQAVSNCTALTWLDLSQCDKMTDEGLRILTNSCTALTWLNLSREQAWSTYYEPGVCYGNCYLKPSQVTMEGLRAVSNLLALTSLDLSGCNNVNAEGLRVVSSLPALTSLDLSGCNNVNAEGLRAVSMLALTSLDLSHCSNLTNEGLRAVSGCTALTHLDVGYCRNITGDGLRAVSSLPTLTSLHIHGLAKVMSDEVQALRCRRPQVAVEGLDAPLSVNYGGLLSETPTATD